MNKAAPDVALPEAMMTCRQVVINLMRRGFSVIDTWITGEKSVIRILPSPRCSELDGVEIESTIYSNSRCVRWAADIDGVRVEWSRILTK